MLECLRFNERDTNSLYDSGIASGSEEDGVSEGSQSLQATSDGEEDSFEGQAPLGEAPIGDLIQDRQRDALVKPSVAKSVRGRSPGAAQPSRASQVEGGGRKRKAPGDDGEDSPQPAPASLHQFLPFLTHMPSSIKNASHLRWVRSNIRRLILIHPATGQT